MNRETRGYFYSTTILCVLAAPLVLAGLGDWDLHVDAPDDGDCDVPIESPLTYDPLFCNFIATSIVEPSMSLRLSKAANGTACERPHFIVLDDLWYPLDVSEVVNVWVDSLNVPGVTLANCASEATGQPPELSGTYHLISAFGAFALDSTALVEFSTPFNGTLINIHSNEGDLICDGGFIPVELFVDDFE